MTSSVILCNVGGIGDHYLALPAIRALVQLLGAKTRLAGHRSAIGLIFGELDGAHEIIDLAQPGAVITDIQRIVDQIGDCDVLVSIIPLINELPDLLISAVKPRAAVGFGVTAGTNVKLNPHQHAFEMYLDVPRALDQTINVREFLAPPKLPEHSTVFARKVRARIPVGMKLWIVHADTKAEKMWCSGRFRDLIHGFVSAHREVFVLVVGSVDLALAYGACAEHVASCVGLPLLDSIALISQADFFVGVDSCLLHIADLFRIPSVGLFGSGDPRHWGFHMACGAIVHGDGTMDGIGVEQARAAMESLWVSSVHRGTA
jgi:hypothetical protein